MLTGLAEGDARDSISDMLIWKTESQSPRLQQNTKRAEKEGPPRKTAWELGQARW